MRQAERGACVGDEARDSVDGLLGLRYVHGAARSGTVGFGLVAG